MESDNAPDWNDERHANPITDKTEESDTACVHMNHDGMFPAVGDHAAAGGTA